MITLEGSSASWPRSELATHCTIGVFDGVHRGHQSILGALRQAAGDGLVGVITFREHPLVLLNPDAAPPMLASLDQRLEAFDRSGVDLVLILDFAEVREFSPEQFVNEIVTGVMNAEYVAVGTGFRFGYQMEGDETVLRCLGAEHGFVVKMLDIVGGDRPISSTSIRADLASGDVAAARDQLGRAFQLRGRVVEGERRGRQLGFPTANLEIDPRRATPARGVYSARTWIGDAGASLDSVVNVGVRPTFGDSVEVVEVHLLDTSEDLYGKELRVDFVNRIRPEQRFANVEELADQIGRDVAAARLQLAHRPG